METKNNLGQKFTLMSLIKFTSPTIFMLVFISFYQMVDGVFVSNFVGTDALSAINIVQPIISVIVAIAIMLSGGGSAIVAKHMGENNYEKARESFTLLIVVGAIIGIILAIFLFIFANDIVLILGATEQLYGYGYDYLIVLIIFSPIAIAQMMFLVFFITAGKPHLGFLFTIMAGITNIVLDYVFITQFNMGIKGAAIATVIGQSIPVLFGIYSFLFSKKLTLYFVKTKFDFNTVKMACFNGSSEMVSNLSTGVTTFMFNSVMLKYVGESGVASITIVLYAQFLLTAVYIGFSSGVAPIFSYNYGYNNKDEIKNVYKLSKKLIINFSVIMVFIAVLLAKQIVGIFTSGDGELFKMTVEGFKIFSISFLFSGINIFSSNMFTAFSNGLVSAIISFTRTFVVLILCLLILPEIIGINGIWLAVPISELLCIFMSIFFFYKYKNKYYYM